MSEAEDLTEPRSASGIQVIARAGEILRALQTTPGGITQAELAERLGLARTTVHRILGALEKEGFVAVSSSRGRYQLGPEIPRMAAAVRRDLLDRLHPYLQELSRQLAETVDLSVLDGTQVMFLDQVVAPQRLRAVSAVGESFPAYSCAPGKAILAGLSPARLNALLPAQFAALTPHTVTSRATLIAQLTTVRESGVAYDLEEHTAGICAAGVVLDTGGPIPMAISVPMPVQRFQGREADLAAALTALSARVRDDARAGG